MKHKKDNTEPTTNKQKKENKQAHKQTNKQPADQTNHTQQQQQSIHNGNRTKKQTRGKGITNT